MPKHPDPFRPDPEAAELFLADLLELYRKHGIYLVSREPIGLSRRIASRVTWPGMRDLSAVPEGMDPDDDAAPVVWRDAPVEEVAIDDLRREAGLRYRWRMY